MRRILSVALLVMAVGALAVAPSLAAKRGHARKTLAVTAASQCAASGMVCQGSCPLQASAAVPGIGPVGVSFGLSTRSCDSGRDRRDRLIGTGRTRRGGNPRAVIFSQRLRDAALRSSMSPFTVRTRIRPRPSPSTPFART